MANNPRYTVDATETSLSVLEALVESDRPLGVTSLSDELGVSKGVVHNHLSTLKARGYVVKREGKYEPSLHLLDLGTRTRGRLPIYDVASEKVTNLAETTGETATLFVLENGTGVPVQIVEHPDSWSPPYREGERMPLHVNAPGKSLLASLPDDRVDAILEDEDLVTPTEATVTDADELESQLRRVRDDGVAFCRGEQFEGIVGVAAVIPTVSETPTAAIGICGPAARLNGRYLEEDITGQVLSTVKSVRIELAGKS